MTLPEMAGVTVCIMHDAGQYFTHADSVEAVLNAIESGAVLKVWWVMAHGQRCTEAMWFDPERVQAIRTESDD